MNIRARLFVTAAATVACLVAAPRAADYPLSLVALASLKSGATSVTSNVVIRVDRLMEESRRTRVTDALKYNGYLGFVPALRTLPTIGSIELARRKVDIKYAVESKARQGHAIGARRGSPVILSERGREKVESRLRADDRRAAHRRRRGRHRLDDRSGDA